MVMEDSVVLVEAAVESVDEAVAAERAGAARLELCANLDVGGTTPAADLIAAVSARVRIPIAVMIRPRGGDFVYSAAELASMHRDIEMARAVGVDGLVVGALDAAGNIDVVATRDLVARAAETPVVFHRAFDRTPDRVRALDELIGVGIARVLTSGGAPTALEGAAELAGLVAQSRGRIEILAGGKVRGNNALQIVRRAGVTQVHARGDAEGRQIGEIVRSLTSGAIT